MFQLVSLILRAWQSQDRAVRNTISFAMFAIVVSGITVAAGYYTKNALTQTSGGVGLGVFAVLLMIVGIVQGEREEEEKAKHKKELVSKVQKNLQVKEKAPGAAWELAQFKIEEYLNKNIQQVSSIYRLVVFVCLCGFALIVGGIALAIAQKDQQLPAILSASSGVMVSFISATFLLVYKNAMEQAKEYMQILERINAVGMSVSILQTVVQDNQAHRDQALIDVSKLLLQMYSTQPSSSSKGSAPKKKPLAI